VNLFKGMIEVACWKIVWAILGAMLLALSFGNAYKAEGNYLTLIVMNFVIAIAMLMTPMMVKSLVGSGLQSMSSAIGAAAVTAMAAAPAKAAASIRTTSERFNEIPLSPLNHLPKGPSHQILNCFAIRSPAALLTHHLH
jgi:uncharacterized membrane protein HdeD (DUF308 family)